MKSDADELKRVIDELRALPEPDPFARARLRQRILAEPVPRKTIWWRRPIVPAALAATLACLLIVGLWNPSLAPQPTVTDGDARPVQFVFVAANASSVSLVGDFNDWDPNAAPLRKGEGGVWSVVLPVREGRFAYSFLVNGREWQADPAAPRVVGEDFGRPSSVLYVSRPQT